MLSDDDRLRNVTPLPLRHPEDLADPAKPIEAGRQIAATATDPAQRREAILWGHLEAAVARGVRAGAGHGPPPSMLALFADLKTDLDGLDR